MGRVIVNKYGNILDTLPTAMIAAVGNVRSAHVIAPLIGVAHHRRRAARPDTIERASMRRILRLDISPTRP